MNLVLWTTARHVRQIETSFNTFTFSTFISTKGVFAKEPMSREPQSLDWKFIFKILIDSVENNARQWAKRTGEEPDILSKWVIAVRSLIEIQIYKLKTSMNLYAKFLSSFGISTKRLVRSSFTIIEPKAAQVSFQGTLHNRVSQIFPSYWQLFDQQ